MLDVSNYSRSTVVESANMLTFARSNDINSDGIRYNNVKLNDTGSYDNSRQHLLMKRHKFLTNKHGHRHAALPGARGPHPGHAGLASRRRRTYPGSIFSFIAPTFGEITPFNFDART